MNLEDEIAYGHLTLKRLSELISENAATADALSIRLSWGFEKPRLYGRAHDNGLLIFERYYENKHTHLLLAELHKDWSILLNKVSRQRRGALRPKKGASDSGMTMGEKSARA